MASMWKKAACIGLAALALGVAGCGSEEKAAVVDYEILQLKSEKIKAITKEVSEKEKEISDRLMKESETATEEEMQQKIAAAQQERQVFIQSKSNQVKSLIETQAAAVAKEKNVGIVMHKMAVPSGAIDITEDVLKRIDGTGSAAKTADKK